ncbi:diguanylate cyclase domain-containing protein [Crenobacter luteus]|uniref:Diguanylate cyclase n=1 Tax=Crenobacter luteus TaxID=1452487 RepID=A0A165FVK1_9NEIS|nr:diguanylate cyclase [Crenobacter luteus]KZE34325.1 hypothetical protein AVW16_06535 [Crenobacter luteus]
MSNDTLFDLTNFSDLLLDAICVVDAEGRFLFVSAAAERIFGYTPGEMVGQPMTALIHPDDLDRTLQAARDIMAGRPNPHFENRYIHKDGRTVHIRWSARWSEKDRFRIAVAHDISERKRAESLQAALFAISEAAHAAEDLSALYRRIHAIVSVLFPGRRFTVALHDAQHGRADAPRDEAGRLAVPLRAGESTIGALVLEGGGDGAPHAAEDLELLQYVGAQIATAIERKQLQGRLLHMACYDELTGLPNRGLLNDRLKQALARARRDGSRLALLYLDLDKFKRINDTLGHEAGDRLLQAFAVRLKTCVRETDTVARLGGDEFVVLIEDQALPDYAHRVAARIQHAFDAPLGLDGRPLLTRPSIGIAHFPEDGDDERQLLGHADNMMYRAKRQRDASPLASG